jgi:hypothetical protein
MTITDTSRQAYQGLRLQARQREALEIIEALISGGQSDVTRNEVDRAGNDREEAAGRPRRTSPPWGPRLGALVALGLIVRVADRPCRASASRSPCQAYTLARAPDTTRTPRVVSLSGCLVGGSTMTAEAVVTDQDTIAILRMVGLA